MPPRVSSANDLAQLDSDAWRKNSSYTNLAALATAHQEERPRAARDVGGNSSERAAQIYSQAMELIHKGLVLVRAPAMPLHGLIFAHARGMATPASGG